MSLQSRLNVLLELVYWPRRPAHGEAGDEDDARAAVHGHARMLELAAEDERRAALRPQHEGGLRVLGSGLVRVRVS